MHITVDARHNRRTLYARRKFSPKLWHITTHHMLLPSGEGYPMLPAGASPEQCNSFCYMKSGAGLPLRSLSIGASCDNVVKTLLVRVNMQSQYTPRTRGPRSRYANVSSAVLGSVLTPDKTPRYEKYMWVVWRGRISPYSCRREFHTTNVS